MHIFSSKQVSTSTNYYFNDHNTRIYFPHWIFDEYNRFAYLFMGEKSIKIQKNIYFLTV